MSTSGTTTWSLNRDQVINSALRKLAVLSGGSTPESFQVTDAAQALNAMIKTFQTAGMPLWAIKSYTFPTVAGKNTYSISVTGDILIPAPLKVLQAYRIEGTGPNIPMNIYTQYNFNLLPVNNNSGPPINLYYQPLNEAGTLKLWPTPSATISSITIFYQRPFEDMNSAVDDFDFPPYWTEALVYGLAWRLSGEYGTPTAERSTLANEAKYFYDQALSFGTEEGSLYLQPNWAGSF